MSHKFFYALSFACLAISLQILPAASPDTPVPPASESDLLLPFGKYMELRRKREAALQAQKKMISPPTTVEIVDTRTSPCTNGLEGIHPDHEYSNPAKPTPRHVDPATPPESKIKDIILTDSADETIEPISLTGAQARLAAQRADQSTRWPLYLKEIGQITPRNPKHQAKINAATEFLKAQIEMAEAKK